MPSLAEEAVSYGIHKISDSIYTNPPMKTLIPVKRLRLCHIFVRLLYLLSTFPPYKQFQATIIRPSIATDLLHLLLFLSTTRGIGGFELSVIPHFNSPGTSAWEILNDRDPRKTLLFQLTDRYIVR